MNSQSLEAGCTYYHVTFADPDLTIPRVEPLVYIGESDDSEAPHLFQDIVSYSRFGSRLHLKGDNDDEIVVYAFSSTSMGSGIVDAEQMLGHVSEAVRRAAKLGYPKPRAGPWSPRP